VEQLRDAFVRFLKRVPFHGAVVACLDDAGVQAILPRLDRRVVTYGLTAQADFRALEIVPQGFGVRFTFRHGGDAPISTLLATPGRHQVQNALAALEGFPGADRRMSRRGEAGGVLVVDDYGHHPTEIRATLAALREAVAERRVVVLFQPHRYSRLEALFDDFARSFYDADQLVVADVYAAGEAPREGIDAERLAAAIAEHGHRGARWGGPLPEAVKATLETLQPGDVLLTLGAGSVGRVHEEILRALGAPGAARG
jgi:UDP-N-acetylmuramate--alanine ligase